uniref:Uncharacterized protein n=1 Tax=Fish-associated picorna-like virus 2 TaxID=3003958 RepID=A0A9E9FWL9_9VIRU|nr:MAG: hypothetical protein [Fish-associated picorna-like virus 2]
MLSIYYTNIIDINFKTMESKSLQEIVTPDKVTSGASLLAPKKQIIATKFGNQVLSKRNNQCDFQEILSHFDDDTTDEKQIRIVNYNGKRLNYGKDNSSESINQKRHDNKRFKNNSPHNGEIKDECHDLFSVFGEKLTKDLKSLNSSINDLSSHISYRTRKKVFSYIPFIENLIVALAGISNTDSPPAAFSIIVLYLKTLYPQNTSFTTDLANLIMNECFPVETQSSGLDSFFSSMRGGLSNWKNLITNPIFPKISFLLSVLVSANLGKMTSLDVNFNGFKLFKIQPLERHVTCLDIIDAVLDTTLYFFEGGYLCFKTKSLAPLLYGNTLIKEFEEKTLFVLSNIDLVRSGSLFIETGFDENYYDKTLEDCYNTCLDLINSSQDHWQRQIFVTKKAQLAKLRVQFNSVRAKGGIRIAPYGVLIHGSSGQGKTTINNIVQTSILKYNNLNSTKEYMVNLNEADKYMSNYRSYINGVTIDDMGNTSPDFVSAAPTQKIIELVNNSRVYANMAEADLKGKVQLEPYVVTITSNVSHLNAATYSQEPVSILRRLNDHIEVIAKPEFCSEGILDACKVASHYNNNVPVIPDLWNLTIRHVEPGKHPSGRRDTADMVITKHNGKNLENISLVEYIRYVGPKTCQHFEQQRALVLRTNSLSTDLLMCRTCNHIRGVCECPSLEEKVVDVQAGELMSLFSFLMSRYDIMVLRMFDRYCPFVISRLSHLCDIWMDKLGICPLKTSYTSQLTHYLIRKSLNYNYHNHWSLSWVNILPESLFNTVFMHRYILFLERRAITGCIVRHLKFIFFLMILIFTILFYVGLNKKFMILYCLFCFINFGFLIKKTGERCSKKLMQQIVLKRDNIAPIFQQIRDGHVDVFKGIAALAVLCGFIRSLKTVWGNKFEMQSSLDPETVEEFSDREATTNPWMGVRTTPIQCNHLQKTSNYKHVIDLISRALMYMEIHTEDGKIRHCNCIFIKSNVVIMPFHIWYVGSSFKNRNYSSMSFRFLRSARGVGGSMFKSIITFDDIYRIPNSDLCVMHVPSGGSFRDLTLYLPLAKIESGQIAGIYRNIDGEVININGDFKAGITGHKECSFDGGEAMYDINTFSGLCMATFVAKGNSQIIGFHLGGVADTELGIICMVTQNQIEDGCQKLVAQRRDILLCHNANDISPHVCGVDMQFTDDVHFKSPINFLEEPSNYKVFGSVTGGSTFFSSVRTSKISSIVQEICGVPQMWGPPKTRPHWKPWRDTLVHVTSPSNGVPPSHLKYACDDLYNQLCHIFIKHKNEIHKLTDIENLNGIPGKRFVDAIKSQTACGFPFVGAKSKYLEEAFGIEYSRWQNPKRFTVDAPDFYQNVKDSKHIYLHGNRCNFIFKACLKDEATKLSSEKVRIFQSAPLTFQLLIREYFLPLVRILSMYPLRSECAVGINSQGPEWDELQGHIKKYGSDRIIAGDYSKYDLRMPAQLVLAAFNVLIEWSKLVPSYSNEDRIIMRGIATDIAYSHTAFNGTLLEFHGSNPSGHNLTVYINSMVNSLLFRCSFLEAGFNVGVAEQVFCENVALMTYGDDAKGSVHKKCTYFDHLVLANYLNNYDIVFTMPNKIDVPVAFMNDGDSDFLKRKNIYSEALGKHFGALDEMSIFKSLHCFRKDSGDSEDNVMVGNIRAALGEWFFHGPEVFEEKRLQLKEVCNRMSYVVPSLEFTYDVMVEKWKEQYLQFSKDDDMDTNFIVN